jgi:hypothetical protein
MSTRWLQSSNAVKCFKVKEKEERREKAFMIGRKNKMF